jgi:valyl-tRNA synthetase
MDMPKAYDPSQVEERRYKFWMDAGLFGAVPGKGRPYCITIPPPNITGSLHIGHALNNSIMDCMIRWRRMSGDNALCLPGTDHAGIATQTVVERELAKEGLTRHDLGREAFVQRCWQWREQYGSRIYLQLQRLGCSYDWSRARFTLDDEYTEAIHEEFLRWWDRGLIYRGTRVVNWCPRCASAISDIEVNTEDRQGFLYHIRYPLADGPGWLVVATTRPETMLGDVAVAVNPSDERYAHLRGAMVQLPLTDRTIPVIFDDYARMDFGTGAVKVTPAHDMDDFEAGVRHGLPQIKVIGDDGRMTEEAGDRYAGLDREECRKKVLEDLDGHGLLERAERYVVKTPLCDRCKTVLEPLLSEQWFVKQRELAQPAIDAVEQGCIRFFPERYAKVYLDWLRNIRDWCISRQLWWGHRIPVWWTDDGRCAAGRTAEDAARRLGVPVEAVRQEEDVLDTWFSSALWPHATLGWPRQTEDLAFWYPTSLLSTAQEIIYLWVARMVMTGMDFMGEVPFRDVYIHATVLDANGERMSKSKGNGVDPLEMIERYGADALRLSLLQQAGKNQDIRFAEERVKIAGTFNNKLWNAARFVLGTLAGVESLPLWSDEEGVRIPDAGDMDLTDRWILSRLQRTITAVLQSLTTYDMDDAVRALYSFVWDEFCDWYVEAAKPRLRGEGSSAEAVRSVLTHVLDRVLRLLHPVIPHITEEIWQALRSSLGAGDGERSIMSAPYPECRLEWINDAAEHRMDLLVNVVKGIRNVRAEFSVPPSNRVRAVAVAGSRDDGLTLSDNAETVRSLARVSELAIGTAAPPEKRSWASFAIGNTEVYVDIGSGLDIRTELARIEKALAAADAEIERIETRLANPNFVERAPAHVVEKERTALVEHRNNRERLAERHRMFNDMLERAESARDGDL